jgi:hypothetical protein
MGLGVVEFHKPYEKNEFSYLNKNRADYYFVEDGFFKVQNSIGSLLLTILNILFFPAFYLLITHQHTDLLIICELLFEIFPFFFSITKKKREFCLKRTLIGDPLCPVTLMNLTQTKEHGIYSLCSFPPLPRLFTRTLFCFDGQKITSQRPRHEHQTTTTKTMMIIGSNGAQNHTATFYFYIAGIGITVGSHRLWAHRAFEAKFPLRLFLMLAQASAGVVSVYSSAIHACRPSFSSSP